jgi:hypothetical protein
LECDYKLSRLITPKELKHSRQILDMLTAELHKSLPSTSATLLAANKLQSALANLSHMQRVVMLKIRTRRPVTYHANMQSVLDSTTKLLNAIRD